MVGVLALQGDFAAHEQALRRAGASTRMVKDPDDLRGLSGLVIPGGESTTLLQHLRRGEMEEALRLFTGVGGCLFGTCAGAILLAREVVSPAQPSLGLIDITVKRNAYGRQYESFEAHIEVAGLAGPPLRAVFIRAPQITRVGPEVEVLASYAEHPVLVRNGRTLLATFHPELTDDHRLHRMFLEMMHASETPVARGGSGR